MLDASDVNKAWTLKDKAPQDQGQCLDPQDHGQGRIFLVFRAKANGKIAIFTILLHSWNYSTHGMLIFADNFAERMLSVIQTLGFLN